MFINTSFNDNGNLYQHIHNDITLITDRFSSYIPSSYKDYSDDKRKYVMYHPLFNESEISPNYLCGHYYNQSINNFPETITYGKNEMYINANKLHDINYTFFWIDDKQIFIKSFDNTIHDNSTYSEISSSTINKLL